MRKDFCDKCEVEITGQMERHYVVANRYCDNETHPVLCDGCFEKVRPLLKKQPNE